MRYILRRRCRQHVNPLKAAKLVPRPAPFAVPDGPLFEVELGCGDAHFLIARARGLPDRLFLGLDIRALFLEAGRQEIARLGLDNVLLETSNLIVDSDRLFLPGRVHRIHINFPDPWFKARQRNRRWLTPETMQQLVRALEPRGEIFFQSDVWELALETLALFETVPGLSNCQGEWTFLRENPFGVRSSREEVCLEEGQAIWRLLFAAPGD